MVLRLVSLVSSSNGRNFGTVDDMQLRGIHWVDVRVDLHENPSLGNISGATFGDPIARQQVV